MVSCNVHITDKALEQVDAYVWNEISPTVFGAVFESTLNPETRRSGGMHYTSIENIHKVIDPLLLNDLKEDLSEIKQISQLTKRKAAIQGFQQRLGGLQFLENCTTSLIRVAAA